MDIGIFTAEHMKELGHGVHELEIRAGSGVLRILQNIGKQSDECRYWVVY